MNKMEQLLQKYKAKGPQANELETLVQKPVRSREHPASRTVNDIVTVVPAQSSVSPGSLAKPLFEVRYITDPGKAGQIVLTEFTDNSIIGLDIETMKVPKFKNHPQAGLSPYLSQIRLVQACQSQDIVYVFDIHKTGLDPLKAIFTKQLVAHNAVFEMSHFFHVGIQIPQADCSMLMYNALYGGLISLRALSLKLLGISISKDEQTSDWNLDVLSQEQIQYAAKDAWLVKQMHPLLMDKLKTQGKLEVYNLLQGAQYPVMKMMYHGCNFDAAAHYLLTENNKRNLKKAEARLKKAIGTGVNLSSGKQLSDHYKTVLDSKILKAWKRTQKCDDLCLDKDTVKKFSHIEPVKPLSEFKQLSKLISSFGDSLIGAINPVTGRLHPNYRIAGAVTGRFSCSKPNLQQIPKGKEYRDLFNAPPGRKIVVADYSQVELRALALLSKDDTMLEAYRNGEDLHQLTAASMADVPPEQVTKEQRSAAKAVNFGISYGMSSKGLVSSAWSNYGVKMSVKKAKENIAAFYEKFPDVKRWGNKAAGDALIYRQAKTKMGRSIKVTGSANTQGRNYVIQGSAGEIMLSAIIEIEKEITESELDIKLVNIIHDEIVLEVAEPDADQAKILLEKAMVNGMLRIFPETEVRGLVDANIGNSWGEAK